MDNSSKIVLKRERTYIASDEDDVLDDGFDDHADDTSYNGNETSRKASQLQYFRWTPTGIALLLKLRFEKESEFNNRTRPKKNLWNEVSQGMKQLGGYIISGEHCDLKFRNMMQTYKKNRLKEERGKIDFINWEYYKYFKEAVGNGNIVPAVLSESNAEETDDVSNDNAEAKKASKSDENETSTATRSSKAVLKTEEKNTTTRSVNSSTDNRIPPKRKRLSKDIEKIVLPDEDDNCIEATSSKVTPQNNSVQCKCNCSQRTMSNNEQNDCKVFGESVGVQMANIRSSCTRSLVKLKIQKILFLAETGQLDKCNLDEDFLSD